MLILPIPQLFIHPPFQLLPGQIGTTNTLEFHNYLGQCLIAHFLQGSEHTGTEENL
jgi:hypothetical protein